MTEYLFRKPQLLDDVINVAINDNTFRSDDLEFTFAARVTHPLNPSNPFQFYLIQAGPKLTAEIRQKGMV